MPAAPGSSTPAPDPAAWQPLTPRGVAAFARAPFRRLFMVQLVVALLAGGAVVWFLQTACLPALEKAIAELPDQGRIQNQLLSTPLTATTTLAAEPVLGFVVDLPRLGKPSLPSDFIVVFHEHDLEMCSPFGCLVFRYPNGWTIEFNRKELASTVPAWAPFALPVVGFLAAILLLLTLALLATLLFLFPILVARYSDRALPFTGSWKLTGAALLPATLLLTASLIVYGHGWIGLVAFTLLAEVHCMVGWLYLVLSPLALPRPPEAQPAAANPFVPPPPVEPAPAGRPPTPERTKNPFTPDPGSSTPEAPPTGSSEPWER